MTLRSATPGRERWYVAALTGRRDEAAEVAARLSSSDEVHRATANSVTGSVVVEFDPDLPRMRVRSLIASEVAAVVGKKRPRAAAQQRSPLPGEHLLRLTRRHRPMLIAATGFTVLEKILEVVTPLLLLFGVQVATGGMSTLLASWGFSTMLSQLVIAGFAFAASAAAVWISHEAHTTLWTRLAQTIAQELHGAASAAELLVIEDFFAEHAGGTLGFGVQIAGGAAATTAIAKRAAAIVLVPASVLAIVAVTWPQPPSSAKEGSRIPEVLREWLRPRHLIAMGAIAAGALAAWLVGLISFELFGLLLILGELVISPSVTIGHHLLAAKAANETARQLVTRNERKVLAISSGE